MALYPRSSPETSCDSNPGLERRLVDPGGDAESDLVQDLLIARRPAVGQDKALPSARKAQRDAAIGPTRARCGACALVVRSTTTSATLVSWPRFG